MKKRILYGLLLTALTLNLFFGARIYFAYAQAGEQDDVRYQNMELFTRVLERVRRGRRHAARTGGTPPDRPSAGSCAGAPRPRRLNMPSPMAEFVTLIKPSRFVPRQGG